MTITLGILAFTLCLIEEIEIDIDMSVQIRELSELLGSEMDFGPLVTGKVKDTGEFGVIVTTDAH